MQEAGSRFALNVGEGARAPSEMESSDLKLSLAATILTLSAGLA